jgi:hypothetical protein
VSEVLEKKPQTVEPTKVPQRQWTFEYEMKGWSEPCAQCKNVHGEVWQWGHDSWESEEIAEQKGREIVRRAWLTGILLGYEVTFLSTVPLG